MNYNLLILFPGGLTVALGLGLSDTSVRPAPLCLALGGLLATRVLIAPSVPSPFSSDLVPLSPTPQMRRAGAS